MLIVLVLGNTLKQHKSASLNMARTSFKDALLVASPKEGTPNNATAQCAL